jgi:Ca2+/Na+ antiporter
MIGILIYLAILFLGLVFVVSRDQTSLLKGGGFLKFNLIFLAVTILVVVVSKQLNENLVTIYLLLIMFFVSILLRKKWLLLKNNSGTTSSLIEDCFSKILIPYQKSENGYIVKVAENSELFLNIVSLWPKCAIISFKGDLHQKKVEVLENFLVKKFAGIFPKLVIKLN